ncbi:tetratricopeptide repeat protein [Streptomyces olivochromogenes]|uniref:tetratricopeptide repeat protein n=1 Tax=Streptomyces olivochromogenes TaxID=1963 RepID=UPI0036DA3C4C
MQLLTGMGGVGKTQLAAHYARTAWEARSGSEKLDVLVWVNAINKQAIIDAYAQAGVELCRGDPNDNEKAAASFLAWLTPKAGASPCRWLIVLDDVVDPNDLRGLWPPDSPHGRTLITTRRRDAALGADGRQTIEVGLFTQGEALAYLTAALTGRVGAAAELIALAGDLGYLPLALAQATAYIIDTCVDVATYRGLLANRATKLSDIAPDVLPDDQARPLAAAWSLSIERADTLKPAGLAKPMLQLASFLSSNGIPRSVLTSDPALAHLTANRTRTEQDIAATVQVSAQDAVGALGALHRLSLVDHDIPHLTVHVHQLIQRATREGIDPQQHRPTAHTAADTLMAVWPNIERDAGLAQALRANTTALTACAGEVLYQPDVHGALYRLGNSLGESGQVTAALNHFNHLAQTSTEVLGAHHPDTLNLRHELAYWRGMAGDAAGASTALTELLHAMAQALGPGHRSTFATCCHAAVWGGTAGDAAGAASVLTRLVHHMTQVLGPDDPDTLTARNNRAYWRGEAGDAAGAATAFADLLRDRLRVLGPEHPDTLATRNNLATWRGEAGDPAGAATATNELLDDCVRILGPDHPDTLTTRAHLAHWLAKTGDMAGAATIYGEVLSAQERVLGLDHPDTRTTQQSIAFLHDRRKEL